MEEKRLGVWDFPISHIHESNNNNSNQNKEKEVEELSNPLYNIQNHFVDDAGWLKKKSIYKIQWDTIQTV